MALAGNIKEFGLADIFQIVSLQQKTGELIVQGKDGTVTILLENGFIVGASATFRSIEERLERALERSEAMNKFQLKRALETQKKTLQPLWTVLAETKAIEPDALKSLLSQQIHETIYHVLRWTEGEYRFEPKKSVEYDRQLISPVNTEFLVMEGFRITDEWPEVEKVISSFQLMVRRVPDALAPKDLSEAESKLLKLLTEERSVQDLIDIGQLGEFDTCQNLYSLITRKVVERVPDKMGKKSVAAARRMAVGFGDILGKAVTILVGIAVLGGVIFLFKYIPENFSLIHKPSLRGIDVMKRFAAQSQMTRLAKRLPVYYLQQKQWPNSLDDLQQAELISSPRLLIDPWGQPYAMTKEQQRIQLTSAGNGDAAAGKELRVVLSW